VCVCALVLCAGGCCAMPAKKSRKKTRAKQAPALSAKLWAAWLKYVMEKAGPRMYFVVFLTGAFCLRMGEALALKRQDLQLDGEEPFVNVSGATAGAQKSPGKVYISAKNLKTIKAAIAKGITCKREVNSRHGVKMRKESYAIPPSGFLFRSRANASQKHLSYQAAYHSISALAPKFLAKLQAEGWGNSPELALIRPHSGRATSITMLMTAGLSLGVTMKWARHAAGSVKVHLRYGQLTHSDVKRAVEQVDKQGAEWPEVSEAKTQILQKRLMEIKQELGKRGNASTRRSC
jgi:integrase